MNSQTAQRKAGPPEGELVSPLTDLDRGRRGYAQAKRSWRPPIDALVADLLAKNRELQARLAVGFHCPPGEINHNTPEVVVKFLGRATREQIAALDAFKDFDWSE